MSINLNQRPKSKYPVNIIIGNNNNNNNKEKPKKFALDVTKNSVILKIG